MRLCVAGTGYVGLVTASCFADAGHDVSGVDTDEAKVSALKAGKLPIFEPELADLVERGRENGALSFTTDYAEAVRGCEAVFVCVGTPTGPDGKSDLTAVLESARSAARALTRDCLLVVKSTVPVGANDRILDIVTHIASEMGPLAPHELDVASNPEFLKEGAAVEDFLRPDRVVIGVRNGRASALLRELYEPFVRTGAPIIETDPRSAEMSKYAANAMLACRVSFMNEVARLCSSLGADVESVRRVVGADRRIGPSFLFPGPGYGGSCFPKDVRALKTIADEAGLAMPIVSAIRDTNRRHRDHLYGFISAHFGGELQGRSIAVWGLAFKPRTDDVRESPALAIIGDLIEKGRAQVVAFDPQAAETARAALSETAPVVLEKVRFARDRYDAVEGADALVLVTEWPEFRRPDVKRLAGAMRGRVVFDWRNVLDAKAFAREGFTVYAVGRPTVGPEGGAEGRR